jgi:hypothetical protein
MAFLLMLLAVIALALLAPRYGVDSRGLTDRTGGTADLSPDLSLDRPADRAPEPGPPDVLLPSQPGRARLVRGR